MPQKTHGTVMVRVGFNGLSYFKLLWAEGYLTWDIPTAQLDNMAADLGWVPGQEYIWEIVDETALITRA